MPSASASRSPARSADEDARAVAQLDLVDHARAIVVDRRTAQRHRARLHRRAVRTTDSCADGPRGADRYRPDMPKRETDRRREAGRSPASLSLRRSSNPVLALQRSIGNRAVGQVLARDPARTGTVKVPGVGEVKVKGGNLEDWAGTATLDTVEVTSQKGKHSAKLEKLSKDRTRADITVMIAPASKAGENLNVGGGIKLRSRTPASRATPSMRMAWRRGTWATSRRSRARRSPTPSALSDERLTPVRLRSSSPPGAPRAGSACGRSGTRGAGSGRWPSGGSCGRRTSRPSPRAARDSSGFPRRRRPAGWARPTRPGRARRRRLDVQHQRRGGQRGGFAVVGVAAEEHGARRARRDGDRDREVPGDVRILALGQHDDRAAGRVGELRPLPAIGRAGRRDRRRDRVEAEPVRKMNALGRNRAGRLDHQRPPDHRLRLRARLSVNVPASAGATGAPRAMAAAASATGCASSCAEGRARWWGGESHRRRRVRERSWPPRVQHGAFETLTSALKPARASCRGAHLRLRDPR